jgi:hypothetical protein
VLGSLKTNGWRKINNYRHLTNLIHTENKTQILNKNIRSRAETKTKIEYFVVVAGCRAKEEMDINRK